VRRLLPAAAALALAVGCGVPQDDMPRALDPSGAPFRVFEQDAVPPPQGDLQVEMWFTRNDRLVPLVRPVQLPGSPREVLEALFAGLAEQERAAGLASALPAGLAFTAVEVRDRIAVVTLRGLNEQVQVLAFAQIVVTLDGRPEVDGVRFRSADRDVQVPRGDGSLTDAPVNRESYSELLGAAEVQPVVPPPPVAPTSLPPAPFAPAAVEPAPTRPAPTPEDSPGG
jgi:hypothetical protein